MANTYEAIATVTVGAGGASNIEFTSIPATFTDIKIVVSARTDVADVADDLAVQINSDGTAGRHSWRIIWGNGSSANSGNSTSDSRGHGGWVSAANGTTSTFSSNEIYIPNYAGSTQKSFSTEGAQENNTSSALISMAANLYNQTTAVTSVKLFSRSYPSSKFVQYSTATLYGIKNS
jgi:hypothetical protein